MSTEVAELSATIKNVPLLAPVAAPETSRKRPTEPVPIPVRPVTVTIPDAIDVKLAAEPVWPVTGCPSAPDSSVRVLVDIWVNEPAISSAWSNALFLVDIYFPLSFCNIIGV